jgi:hypothetical protein
MGEFKGEETLLKLRFRANLLPVDVGITGSAFNQRSRIWLAAAQNSAGALPVFVVPGVFFFLPIFVV